MTENMHATFRFLGAIYVLLSLGCGQPRVYVVTSTTLGLEATPPMSDGSGVPRVTFGYKRSEVALIPVCPVEKYKYMYEWLSFLDIFSPEVPPCPDNKQKASVKSSTTDTPAGNGSTTNANTDNNKDKPSESFSLSTKDQQDAFHQSSTLAEGPGEQVRRQDAYSTLGLFRLGLSWFGPAKIEQFVATGQAAVELQKPLPLPLSATNDQKEPFSRPPDTKAATETTAANSGKATLAGKPSTSAENQTTTPPSSQSQSTPTDSPSTEPAVPALEPGERKAQDQPSTPSDRPNL